MRTQGFFRSGLFLIVASLIVACGDDDSSNDNVNNNNTVTCGNGSVDSEEQCDGADLAGNDCTSIGLGFTGGVLLCNTTCTGYETRYCNTWGTTCGNGVVEAGERCDGPNLAGMSCTSLGMQGGTLACTATCQFDTSGCFGDMCQQNGWYNDGWCDLCELYGGTVDPDCAVICHTSDGQCGSYSDDVLGVSTCVYAEGSEDPDCGACGNGVTEDNEMCDGTDLAGSDCASLGFPGGTLACTPGCLYDLSGCTPPPCGNDTAEALEICDGADLRGNDCTSIGLGFVGGTLACNTACDGWDTSACTLPTCGDDVAEGNELCDGADLAGNDCPSIGLGFVGGTLACNTACDGWDTSACASPTCGDGTREGAEECEDGNSTPGDGCHDCLLEPDPIAAPGSSITLTGSLDSTDPQWARPYVDCGATTPADHYYDFFAIQNTTGTSQTLTITATWQGGDGYLHVYRRPFDPRSTASCVIGNDDYVDTTQSRITPLAIGPGEVLIVVASTYDGNDPIGAYSIEVLTQ